METENDKLRLENEAFKKILWHLVSGYNIDFENQARGIVAVYSETRDCEPIFVKADGYINLFLEFANKLPDAYFENTDS